MFVNMFPDKETGFRAELGREQAWTLASASIEHIAGDHLEFRKPHENDELIANGISGVHPAFVVGTLDFLDHIQDSLSRYATETMDTVRKIEQCPFPGDFKEALMDDRCYLGLTALQMAEEIEAARLAQKTGLHEDVAMILALDKPNENDFKDKP